MKFLQSVFTIAAVLLFSSSIFASTADDYNMTNPALSDSNINFMAEVSLWHEFHKNHDFESALEHGWTILRVQPSFTKYRYYKKMEEMLMFMHDSVASNDGEKKVYADTLLYLYNKAIEHDKKNRAYFLARKAFVLETWEDIPIEEQIQAYLTAIEADPNLDSFYKDRLGLIYIKNGTDENGYKLKALELYSDLSEKDPENELWNTRILSIAENPEDLMKFTKIAWDLDKENSEKAWKYASTCLKFKEYEKSIEPLEFLTKKAPDVINYWSKLATSYDKIGKENKALKAYKTLIDLQPDNRDNYVNIAILYKKLDQLSVARSYLQKASKVSPDWDYPYLIEAQIYEQAARNCGFEFMDRVVYQLAVNIYKKAAKKGGSYSSTAMERVKALKSSVPQKEDYFFRKLNSGDSIKIEGRCYDWIGRSIIVP